MMLLRWVLQQIADSKREKSREDREGLRMIFTLLPDYTYSISPAPDRTEEVVIDTPNKHTLDILRFDENRN